MKKTPLWANLVVLAAVAGVLAVPSPAAAAAPVADGFSYPIGDGSVRQSKGDGDGWYVSTDFGDARGSGVHVGEDWNTDGGSNTDYGEPVLAAAAGTIRYAGNPGGGWGNVMLVEHLLPDGRRVTTQYAHLAGFTRRTGIVRRGEKIATVGTGGGMYTAHLHFELRTDPSLAANVGGTERSTDGWTDPSSFIDAHRRLTFDADAPAMATDRDGRTYMVAMRKDGSIFLRTRASGGGWSSFVRQAPEATWSRAAGITLVASGSRVWLAAVTRTGSLRVRPFAAGRGGDWRTLGDAATWSTDAGAAMTDRSDGAVVLSAVRRDGTLFTVSWSPDRGWGSLVRQGAPGSWATGAAPEVVGIGRSVLLFAVGKDATLRWRRLGGPDFQPLDSARWSTDSGVSAARVGTNVIVSGVRANGSLHTRRRLPDGSWSASSRHGDDRTWSTAAAPSLVVTGTTASLFAVTATGTLYAKRLGGGASFSLLGPRSAWSRDVGSTGVPLAGGQVLVSSIRRDGSLYTWSWGDDASSAFSQQGTSGSWAS